MSGELQVVIVPNLAMLIGEEYATRQSDQQEACESHNTKPPSQLTQGALAHHQHQHHPEVEQLISLSRVDRLAKAACDLGFELPRSCLDNEKWQLEDWVKEVRTFPRQP